MTNKKNRNSTTPSSKANDAVVIKNLGKKRPREEDDSEEEMLTINKPNAKHVKKLKQMIAVNGDHSESEEASDDAADSNDSVEGDSDDNIDVDSKSDDDSDDAEDESDEDFGVESADEDDDSDEDMKAKVSRKSDKSQAKSSKQQNKKDVATVNPTKKSPEKSKTNVQQPQIQSEFTISPANVLFFNIPRLNEQELRGFLGKRGVQPESVSCINTPVALVGLPNEAAVKKTISACSGCAYGQTNIAVVSVTGDDIKMIRSNKNPHPGSSDGPLTCVFATFIPKNVTEEEILKVIGIKPKNIRLITTGSKNKSTNACYVDCHNEDDAKKAYQSLQGREFGSNHIKAFLKPMHNYNPITETSFVVSNVPFTASVEDMKKEFPSAQKIEIARKGSFLLTFASVDTRDKALALVEGKVMDGRTLRAISTERSGTDVSVFVGNLPFTVTTGEIKEIFPQSKGIKLLKNKEGRPNGSAFVFFSTKKEAETAVTEGTGKQLNGRALRVKLEETHTAPAAATEDKPKPKPENPPKQAKKSNLPAQVGSESESGEDEDEKNDEGEDSASQDDKNEKESSEDSDEGSADEDEESSENEDEPSEDNDEEASGDDKHEEEPPAKRPKPQAESSFKPNFRGRGGNFNNRGNRGGNFQRGGRGGNFNQRGNRGGFQRGGRGRSPRGYFRK